MKVAICHDYLYQFGGAEKCLQQWLKIYPQAEIYTSFSIPEKFKGSLEITQAFQEKRVKNSFLQWFFNFPWALKFQKHLFWLYPLAALSQKVINYDLVIVSSTYSAKYNQIIGAKKILFYCYTPTRFLHGFITETDRKTINPFLRMLIPLFTYWIRIIDLWSVKKLAEKKAVIIAISKYIQRNILKVYKLKSKIIYPPVNLKDFYSLSKTRSEIQDFYLYFGRISFHKRVDLVIESCLELGKKLVIVGSSSFPPEMQKLKNLVGSDSTSLVEFKGRVDDAERNHLLTKAKAMIFPAKEDFGIAPVEAVAAGCPVLAFKAGGALEYIVEGLNGYFFSKQTKDSLKQAILKFEASKPLNIKAMRESVKKFDEENFKSAFLSI